MTFIEALQKEKRWYKRALIINLYHNTMLLKKEKWNIRLTAKRLEIGLGTVSESLRLAKALIDNPKLEFGTREDALKMIK